MRVMGGVSGPVDCLSNLGNVDSPNPRKNLLGGGCGSVGWFGCLSSLCDVSPSRARETFLGKFGSVGYLVSNIVS